MHGIHCLAYTVLLWNNSRAIMATTIEDITLLTFVAFLALCPALLILQCWRASLAISDMNF